MKRELAILLHCSFLILALAGCEKESPEFNPTPPMMGFGALEQSVIIGSQTAITLYLNKGLPEPVQIPVDIGGAAVAGIDYTFVGDPFFVLEPGQTEATLIIAAPPSQEDRSEKNIILTLPEIPGLRRVEERKRVEIVFSLEHTVNLRLWAKDEPFPILYGYTSFGPDPVPETSGLDAGKHFCFAYISRVEANVIGLYNPQEGRSTNALNLHRIYAGYNVSTGSANIRIPQAFRFIPAFAGATFGRVEVIQQKITITRTASSGLPPFQVGLSGEGTYSEETGRIELDIYFDETEIGGGDRVLRKYVYEKEERP